MNETTRQRLLTMALAQRKLSIGLGVLVAALVVGGVAIGFGGRNSELTVQGVALFVCLYLAAATFHLSRVLGDARGLGITLAVVTLFVPFAILVVPPVLLGRARRMLRAEGGGAVEAGFFAVKRAELEWLRREPGMAMVCFGCGYDLAGIGERAVCPECGRARK